MDIQAKKPASLAGDAGRRLLKARGELVQAMSEEDWERGTALCDETLGWLKTLP